MLSDLEKFIEASAERYGHYGDDTLEYIGIVLKNKAPYARKLYYVHNKKETKHETDRWEKSMWEKYFRRINEEFPLELCDVSKGINESIPSLRMVASLNSKLSEEQTYSLAEKYLNCMPQTAKKRFIENIKNICSISSASFSPLIQIGVEADENNNYMGFKYYLRPAMSKGRASEEDIEMLCRLQYREAECRKDFKMKLCSLIECGYSPAFIGINDYGDIYESKLYFVSKLFGRSLYKNAYGQIINVCDSLSFDKEIRELMLRCLEKHKLYPEGIAFSDNSEDIIRLYFKEISPKLLGKNIK